MSIENEDREQLGEGLKGWQGFLHSKCCAVMSIVNEDSSKVAWEGLRDGRGFLVEGVAGGPTQ